MKGITIVETEALDLLINRIDMFEEMFMETIKKLEAGGRPWMDVKETAEYIRKSTSWVYQNKSMLGFSKPGADILFNKKKVDAYLWSAFHQAGQE